MATRARRAKSKTDVDADPHRLSDEERARLLAEDELNKSLNVRADGRPLFTSATSLSQLTRNDACSYIKFESLSLALSHALSHFINFFGIRLYMCPKFVVFAVGENWKKCCPRDFQRGW